MKAHEIIKELRQLAPNGILELLTISESIKELRDYVHESKNSEGAWQLIDLIEQLSDCVVTLSQFVACDANGVPLDKPVNPCDIGECSDPCCYSVEFDWIREAYNEAQKSVVFEGWEVHFVDFYGNTRIKRIDNEISIDFSKDNTECRVFFNIKLNKRIKSLADLAAATQLNPIKLK